MILSIIIPVFNEEATIEKLLEKVKAVNLPSGIKKEIIVIDDGSRDRTVGIINNIKPNWFKFLKHQKNLGKGAAIETGLNIAKGDLIIIQDADLEYNPQDYSRLLTPILEKKAKVVYGTRLTNYKLILWGGNKTILPTHLLANRFLTWLTNFLFDGNLTDMETCYKLFTKDIFSEIDLKSDRFDFEPEITAKILKQKIKIIEIPITTKPRTHLEGKKIGWKDGFQAIWTLIKYRFVD